MTNDYTPSKVDIRLALQQLAEHGTPSSGTAPVFDVGTSEYLNFFKKELLEQLVEYGGATCRFFEGPAGSGKSHLLQLLEGLARTNKMAVVRIELSRAINVTDWELVTELIIQDITVTFPNGTVRGLPKILEQLGSVPSTRIDRLENAMLPHPGFKAAMIQALHHESLSDEAWVRLAEFLSGQKIGVGTLRKLNVFGVKNPLSKRNAEQVLNTVLGGLYYLGIPGTVLLFDENEKVFEGHSYQVKHAANLMRRLIDGCFTGGLVGTVAVFAVFPGFIESCSHVYPALGQRLQVIRDGPYKPAWRWPVLSIEEVSTVKSPEKFLEETIKKLIAIVEQCHGSIDNLPSAMRITGERVLHANAGMGYRRPLVKALASIALQRL